MTMEELTGFANRFATLPFTITIVGDKHGIDLTALEQYGEVTELAINDLFAW